MQEPSEDKSKQNRKDIHGFSEKVSQITDTFENLRFWTKKVSKLVGTFINCVKKMCKIAYTFNNLRFGTKKMSEIVKTFKKNILKVKKTDGFLKVTCRKCDRGLRNSRS